ncbi:PHB depolymerase family esterase [Kitasatospora sp. NPDC094015]|uniref:extracellular catalytic domain type 2 short-chain-length polyhydroxyalkanoate depolymerase n=1 Tax=Kitasatospora sp. NPDC094015 TaxID=3155205 RepID=UPI003325C70B
MVFRALPRLSRTLKKAAALAAATALAALGPVAPARAAEAVPGLPHLNLTAAYVTGVSSGGFLATQLQVAYSGTFDGAGIVAAGPYDCGQGNVVDAALCLVGHGLPDLEQQTVDWARQGRIDPVANLAGKPVYVYHGRLDPVVNPLVSDSGVAFYRDFGADVRYHDGDWAGHSWPSPQGVVPCGLTLPPFVNDCGDDPQREMLTHWLGRVDPANYGAPAGSLTHFDQNRYTPGGRAADLSMDDTGMLYTPPACAAGQPCKLVVALHGCLSGQYLLGDLFPRRGNLDTYADTNHLVVLYPQAVSSLIPINPQGCWDWFGYTGHDFAVKDAPQLRAITAMVHTLGA